MTNGAEVSPGLTTNVPSVWFTRARRSGIRGALSGAVPGRPAAMAWMFPPDAVPIRPGFRNSGPPRAAVRRRDMWWEIFQRDSPSTHSDQSRNLGS